jgi:hypothetical protein
MHSITVVKIHWRNNINTEICPNGQINQDESKQERGTIRRYKGKDVSGIRVSEAKIFRARWSKQRIQEGKWIT